MIYILEDNPIMAECIARACRPQKTRWFTNAVEAIAAIDEELPELIFLDILLDGPDGFTFLNELASYSDTAKIPAVIISSINIEGRDLSSYGIAGVLNKDTMMPKEIKKYVERFTN